MTPGRRTPFYRVTLVSRIMPGIKNRDRRVGPEQCPLLVDFRTQVREPPRSKLCQERTHAAQQNDILFDDLVSGGEQRRRYGEFKYTGRLRIGNEFELRRFG